MVSQVDHRGRPPGRPPAHALQRLHRAPWRVLAARIVVNGLAVALVVLILPGVRASTSHPVLGYLFLGVLFGLINAFIKPAIQFVAVPLLAGSMGLVVIVVDVVIFWLLDSLTKLLNSSGPLWVILAAVLLGLLSYVLDNLFGLVPPIMPDSEAEEWAR